MDNSSAYENLEEKKFYSVNLTSFNVKGERVYQANGEYVAQEVYEQFSKSWENMENCCPCILKSYDEHEILLKEAVSCMDCEVGYYKEFYSNGNLKLKGQYIENYTNDWDDISARGYCSVFDGEWIFFDESGTIKYKELWDAGDFIEQEPSSGKVEIWGVELTLNGNLVDKDQTVSVTELHHLKVEPRYKNELTSPDLILKLRLSATGYKNVTKEVKLEEFDWEILKDLMNQFESIEIETLNIRVSLYQNDNFISGRRLKLTA